MAIRKTALVRAPQLRRRRGRLCQKTCHGFPPAIRTRTAVCPRVTEPGHQLPAPATGYRVSVTGTLPFWMRSGWRGILRTDRHARTSRDAARAGLAVAPDDRESHPCSCRQPGSDDGRWQLDVADPRSRPDAHRRGHRRSGAPGGARRGARSIGAGAGAGHPCAHRPRGRCSGDSRRRCHQRVSARCSGLSGMRSGRFRTSRCRTADIVDAGDDDADGRPHTWSRARSPVFLARADTDAVLRRPGGEGHDRLDSGQSARGSRRLSGVTGARPGTRSPIGCCRHTARSSTSPETVLRGYIEHRLEREQQILDAMQAG